MHACRRGWRILSSRLAERTCVPDARSDLINNKNRKCYPAVRCPRKELLILSAAKNGNFNSFRRWVDASCTCDLTTANIRGKNVLHLAVISTVTHALRLVFIKFVVSKALVDIDSKSMKGNTAAMFAVTLGFKDILGFLAGEHCDLTTWNKQGNNILHMAVESGHLSMVKYIVENHLLDLNLHNRRGQTALGLAVFRNLKVIVKYLEN